MPLSRIAPERILSNEAHYRIPPQCQVAEAAPVSNGDKSDWAAPGLNSPVWKFYSIRGAWRKALVRPFAPEMSPSGNAAGRDNVHSRYVSFRERSSPCGRIGVGCV